MTTGEVRMIKKWKPALFSTLTLILVLLLSQTAHTSNEIIVSLEDPPADDVYLVDDVPIEIGININMSDNLFNNGVGKGTLLCDYLGAPYSASEKLNEENLLGITCYAILENEWPQENLSFVGDLNQTEKGNILKNNVMEKLLHFKDYGKNSVNKSYFWVIANMMSPFLNNNGVVVIPPNAPDGTYTADCAVFYKTTIPGYGERTCAVMAFNDSFATFAIESSEPDNLKPKVNKVMIAHPIAEQGEAIKLTINGTDDSSGIDTIEGKFEAIITGGYSGNYNFIKTIPFTISKSDGNCTTEGEYPEKTWSCTKSIQIPPTAYPGIFALAIENGDLELHDKFWVNEKSCDYVSLNPELCGNPPTFKIYPFSLKKKLQRKRILLKKWFQNPYKRF